jgi:hypothetical protein
MLLYRPVGIEELRLVFLANASAFPPRLPEQPIFYPVLNRPYAQQIARDWNTKADSQAGYVTCFDVPESYLEQFPRKIVGQRQHEELWVPAEQLSEFNEQIVGTITILDAYFGEQFQGMVPDQGSWAGRNAMDQWIHLVDRTVKQPETLAQEIVENAAMIYIHMPYWQTASPERLASKPEEKRAVIAALMATWQNTQTTIPLGLSGIE